jgi:hypothetical protein
LSKICQIKHQLKAFTLKNIFISRAFTAYQATALITHQLKEAIKKYNAKLVILSDIAGFFWMLTSNSPMTRKKS